MLFPNVTKWTARCSDCANWTVESIYLWSSHKILDSTIWFKCSCRLSQEKQVRGMCETHGYHMQHMWNLGFRCSTGTHSQLCKLMGKWSAKIYLLRGIMATDFSGPALHSFYTCISTLFESMWWHRSACSFPDILKHLFTIYNVMFFIGRLTRTS